MKLLNISTPYICIADPHAGSVVLGIIFLSVVLLALVTAMTTGCCFMNENLIMNKDVPAVPP